MLQILHKTNINFMGWKNVSFAVSAVMITLGIFALVQIGRGQGEPGHRLRGRHDHAAQLQGVRVPIDQARAALDKSGFHGASIQQVGEGGNKILIRLRESEGASDKVQTMFRQEFPNNAFDVYSIMEIGPVIGQALQSQSLWAITISIIGIVIYIAFRFQFKFGVAAAIATIHDVCAVLAIFFLMHKEINLLVDNGTPDAGRLFAHGHGCRLRPHQGEPETQQEGRPPEAGERQHQRGAFPHDHHLAYGRARAHPAGGVWRRGAA